MKSRRAVGGLISMIGLLVVFGVIGVAFLSLSTQQTSLFSTQQRLGELQHDRNLEQFVGEVLNCKKTNSTHLDFVTLRINNTSSQSLSLDSVILYNTVYQNVTDANYLNGTKIRIQPQESKIFDLTDLRYLLAADTPPLDHARRIIITTSLGNKAFIDHDFDTCSP